MTESSWVVGFHAVLAVLEGSRPVEVVWLQDGRRDGRMRRVEEAARRRQVVIQSVSRARLEQVAGGAAHTGCAARTGPVQWSEIEELVAPEGSPARLLLLDGVTDPHNIGAVIRTAAAFALDGVVLAGPSAPPLGGTVARAAAGQLERVRLARATVAADVLAFLQGQGYWVLGADSGGRPVTDVEATSRWVLCVGAEERGLRAKTRSRIDEWVAIPMAPGVESLNLSVSAALLVYELGRSVRPAP